MQVGFHCARFTSPLAASLVVGAVDLEHVDALLKVLVFEVVEVWRVAVWTCCIDIDPSFNAILAVVVAAAHNLHWLTKHL